MTSGKITLSLKSQSFHISGDATIFHYETFEDTDSNSPFLVVEWIGEMPFNFATFLVALQTAQKQISSGFWWIVLYEVSLIFV